VVVLKRRFGLAVRYSLPRRQRVKGPSIGLVRDLLLCRSFFFAHFFAFSTKLEQWAWLIRQHHQSLHNRAETNEYNKQLEKICKLRIRANFSIAQKQIAPTTTIIKIPIKSEIIEPSLCR
jgi:hypothetical protein